MSVAFELNEGKVIIDVNYLLDAMSDQAKLDLVERLAVEDVVIKHVVDQIVEGFTENCYAGSRCAARPLSQTSHWTSRTAELLKPAARSRKLRLLR